MWFPPIQTANTQKAPFFDIIKKLSTLLGGSIVRKDLKKCISPKTIFSYQKYFLASKNVLLKFLIFFVTLEDNRRHHLLMLLYLEKILIRRLKVKNGIK